MSATLSPSIPLQLSEQTSRLSDDERWPRAWRLLFILGASFFLWAAIVAVVRWI